MGDVVDLARGLDISTFGMPASRLVPAKPATAAVPAAYYLRMELEDKPGALAKVAAALGEAGVSIDRMHRRGACGIGKNPGGERRDRGDPHRGSLSQTLNAPRSGSPHAPVRKPGTAQSA